MERVVVVQSSLVKCRVYSWRRLLPNYRQPPRRNLILSVAQLFGLAIRWGRDLVGYQIADGRSGLVDQISTEIKTWQGSLCWCVGPTGHYKPDYKYLHSFLAAEMLRQDCHVASGVLIGSGWPLPPVGPLSAWLGHLHSMIWVPEDAKNTMMPTPTAITNPRKANINPDTTLTKQPLLLGPNVVSTCPL